MAVIYPLVGSGSGELLTTLLGADDRPNSEVYGRYFAAFHPLIRASNGATDIRRYISAYGGRLSLVTSIEKRDLPLCSNHSDATM
jgi:hypothetical protein